MYFLKLKLKEDISYQFVRECLTIQKVNYLYRNNKEDEQDLTEFKNYLTAKRYNIAKGVPKSTISFDITDYIGTIQYAEIQDTFSYIMRGSIA